VGHCIKGFAYIIYTNILVHFQFLGKAPALIDKLVRVGSILYLLAFSQIIVCISSLAAVKRCNEVVHLVVSAQKMVRIVGGISKCGQDIQGK